MKKQYRDYYKKLGLNIAYYRHMAELTQEQLAEKIQIDQSHMSKIEVANVGISLDVLFALSQALSITPNKLLEFRD